MKKRLPILALVLAALAVLLVLRSRRSTESLPPAVPSARPVPSAAVSSTPSATPSVQASPSAAVRRKLSPHAIATIRKCLRLEATSLEDVMRGLRERTGENAQGYLNWRNVHVTLPNGEKRRVRISDTEQPKVFAVDAQGLPIPLPPVTDEEADTIIRSGQRTFAEHSMSLHFGKEKDSPGVEIISENGALRSLHYSDKGEGLGCDYDESTSAVECQCL